MRLPVLSQYLEEVDHVQAHRFALDLIRRLSRHDSDVAAQRPLSHLKALCEKDLHAHVEIIMRIVI
jgi:hypothetical protein